MNAPSTQSLAVLLLSTASMALTGCADVTTLVVVTDAPPGRVAEVDPDDETIRLSTGVAVAVECFFQRAEDVGYGPALGGPCDGMEIEAVTEEGEPLLTVLPAHLENSAWGYNQYGYQAEPGTSQTNATGTDRAVFVLVGERPGIGALIVRHEDAELRFAIEVFPGEGGP